MIKSRFDKDAAAKKFISNVTSSEEKAVVPVDEHVVAENISVVIPEDLEKESNFTNEDGISKKKGRKSSSTEKLIQKTYYITEKQSKALKLHCVLADETDMSFVVRAALDLYLADILATLDKKSLI